MHKAILILTIATLAGLAVATPAEDRLWATRVRCELQTAGGTSLQDLTWQQGTTPLLSLDQYRSGKAVDATNTVTAIVTFGPSATNQYYVTRTNYAVSGNGYLVRIPTVGTNTTGVTAGWWYTAYFEIGGYRYWTGNGRVDIEATTSTEDGLTWQEITTTAAVTNEAALRVAGDAAGSNNVTAVRTELTNSIAGNAYSIATNAAAIAAERALRVAGDEAATNHVLAVYATLTNAIAVAAQANTNHAIGLFDFATNVTAIASNALAQRISILESQTNTWNAALQPPATNGIPHGSLSGILGAGSLHVSAADTNKIALALTNETTTLATAAARGGFAGTETIGPLAVTAQRYGIEAGLSASGAGWGAYGGFAGSGASGDGWGAYGAFAGGSASHTNSHAFGRYAGRTARGNNRMYLDVYAAAPAYEADGATNDTVFMDSDGKLYLGGGAGRSENPSAGGELRGEWLATGKLTTERDMTTTAPTSDELVNAGWVRSLAMQGQEWYWTATVTNGFGQKTTNFVALSASPDGVITTAIPSPVASDTYLAGGVATQMFGAVRSPITFEVWCARVGGSAVSVVPAHPEVYYVYAGTTNHLGDWEAGDQNIAASTTPTKYTWTVSFPEPTITGGVYIVGYLKSGTVSGPAAGLEIYGGGAYDSHMTIDAVNAGESAADVAADLATHEALTTTAHGGIVASSSIPGPGCTDLGATNAPAISGATVAYTAAPTTTYTLSVSESAPRYVYAVEIVSTNTYTLAEGLYLQGSWSITGTNILSLVPGTGTVWRVYGRGL